MKKSILIAKVLFSSSLILFLCACDNMTYGPSERRIVKYKRGPGYPSSSESSSGMPQYPGAMSDTIPGTDGTTTTTTEPLPAPVDSAAPPAAADSARTRSYRSIPDVTSKGYIEKGYDTKPPISNQSAPK